MRGTQWWRGILFLASLAAAARLFDLALGGSAIDEAWIDGRVRSHGAKGELLFVGVAVLSIALGVPRQSLCFLGAYAFGLVHGGGLALGATLLGSLISFYYARWFVGEALRRRLVRRAQPLDAMLARHPFLVALIVRLLPVGSNLATNVAGGVSRVRAPPFFLGSLIGYLPQTAVFALAGSGIEADSIERTGFGIVLFVVSGVFGLWLHRRYVCNQNAPRAAAASAAPR